MLLDYDHASLLLVTRDRLKQGPCMVVTVGLLYDAGNSIVAPDLAQHWLTERFAGQPFDRGLKKSRGTFAVHGNAYPLSAAQQTGMSVRVNVGFINKTLHVYPPRVWRKGLLGWSPSVTGALTPVPVDLQHAYGSADSPDNQYGSGYTLSPDTAENLALPQIETPHSPLRAPGEAAPVASLLPLLPQSRERRAFLGYCDDAWVRQRAPFVPIDTDPRWFDEVAQDQVRPGYWVGNEAWSVAGMHPRHPDISGHLPGFRPRLFIKRHLMPDAPVISEAQEATLELDTVWLFPDSERVLLLYRAQVPVHDIDGHDLAAVAVRCERATEPCQSEQQWLAELWPHRLDPAADLPGLPGDAALADDQEEKLARLSADVEADMAAFLAVHEKSLSVTGPVDPVKSLQAAQAMEQGLRALLPRLQASLTGACQILADGQEEPLSSALGSLGGIQTPADAEAYRVQIETLAQTHQPETLLAANEAVLDQQVHELARLLDKDPQVLRAEIEAVAMPPEPAAAQIQLDTLLGDTDLDAVLVELETTLQQQLEEAAGSIGLSAQQLMSVAKAEDPVVRFTTLLSGPLPDEGTLEAQIRAQHIGELEALIVTMKNRSPQAVSDGIAPDWTRELLQASHGRQQALDGELFVSLDLSGLDLRAAVLTHCQFQQCQFLRASLDGADLSHSRFIDCTISDASLTGANLDGAIFERCAMDRIQAPGAGFNAVYARHCSLDGAELSGAKGRQMHWVECSFVAARLHAADWSGALWLHSDLSGADMSEAKLGKTRFQTCDLAGVKLTRADLQGAAWSACKGADIDLRHACLQHWQLDQGCHLPSACLDDATLDDASLQHAFLHRASLRNARLLRALVIHCDLSHCDGYRMDARDADFTGTDFSHAACVGANWLEARLRKVNLTATDLRGSNLHGCITEGAHGSGALFQHALLTRCRVLEDLSRA